MRFVFGAFDAKVAVIQFVWLEQRTIRESILQIVIFRAFCESH